MQKRFYEIKVYDGMELLFEREEPVGRIGEGRLRDLLQALVVKHALTPEEIVDGHLNRNARGYRAPDPSCCVSDRRCGRSVTLSVSTSILAKPSMAIFRVSVASVSNCAARVIA